MITRYNKNNTTKGGTLMDILIEIFESIKWVQFYVALVLVCFMCMAGASVIYILKAFCDGFK